MEENLKFSLSPRYNFIYELGMATGRKTKKSAIAVVISIIMLVCGSFGIDYLSKLNNDKFSNIAKVKDIYVKIMLVVMSLFIVKTLIHIIIQIIQYKYISYNFYEDRIEYKDTFLNQQTKVIKYESIKEIEIRRNIWERINGLGIIIIYTSAEKTSRSGLVIYAIKNTEEIYNKIRELALIKKENKEESSTEIKEDSSEVAASNDIKNEILEKPKEDNL